MDWHVVHTKQRQEKCALRNLEQQGYVCYLPILRTEKLVQRTLMIGDEPLFPRYLFIQLGKDGTSKSWSPIRSTKGVSRLVSFGATPAKVEDQLIELLKSQERTLKTQPQRLFEPGERVKFTAGAFAGIEGIYHMPNGENRVMVLIELLSKPMYMSLPPISLCKVG